MKHKGQGNEEDHWREYWMNEPGSGTVTQLFILLLLLLLLL
jgi:hypothetical protein